MSILYVTYGILTTLLFIAFFPAFWLYSRLTGRYREGLEERLGCYPPEMVRTPDVACRIWLHAASLGEVRVAVSLIRALNRMRPDCSFVLSTVTAHGRNMARTSLDEGIPVIYAPLDFILSLRKAMHGLRPDVMVFVETEIWPNWIMETNRLGIKIGLINGRISNRSVKAYLRLRPFFRDVLSRIDRFSMILPEDGERIKAMGADPRKVEIHGNAKYDLLPVVTPPDAQREMRRLFSLEPSARVLVAGSTRKGEEALILQAYKAVLKAFPDTLLLMAPRHIRRIPSIAALVERRGFRCHLRSELHGNGKERTAPVILVDTFGELFHIYSIATIVFCGASLVPLGGQNPLEPAAWSKPVFYGPHMDNFLDAQVLLERNGGGVQVSGVEDFAEKVIRCLGRPDALKEMGEGARRATLKAQGAAEQHARVICRLLEEKP